MREKPTFWEQVRSDLSTFKMEWQQLQSRVQKLLTPRGYSEQGDLNDIIKASAEIRVQMGDLFTAVQIYKEMEETLDKLLQRARALGEIYGVSIAFDDFLPVTRPLQPPIYKQLPVDKYELLGDTSGADDESLDKNMRGSISH